MLRDFITIDFETANQKPVPPSRSIYYKIPLMS